jgi:hypothetical protein
MIHSDRLFRRTAELAAALTVRICSTAVQRIKYFTAVHLIKPHNIT